MVYSYQRGCYISCCSWCRFSLLYAYLWIFLSVFFFLIFDLLHHGLPRPHATFLSFFCMWFLPFLLFSSSSSSSTPTKRQKPQSRCFPDSIQNIRVGVVVVATFAPSTRFNTCLPLVHAENWVESHRDFAISLMILTGVFLQKNINWSLLKESTEPRFHTSSWKMPVKSFPPELKSFSTPCLIIFYLPFPGEAYVWWESYHPSADIIRFVFRAAIDKHNICGEIAFNEFIYAEINMIRSSPKWPFFHIDGACLDRIASWFQLWFQFSLAPCLASNHASARWTTRVQSRLGWRQGCACNAWQHWPPHWRHLWIVYQGPCCFAKCAHPMIFWDPGYHFYRAS